ncbi:SLAP domain-containing protein [Lactobacillus helveticus]|uniref:SLAP domain-containing protein n=1 Tax=Lactobacillus helveticus TaxID=1587 RepID=UPI000712B47A|nr:SLAP domain-containing protein [Lactobacillus helveticus]KRO14881.1 surface layer protein [Lactobacillus helveticus]GFP00171.1 surface layer protein [Lactobacillus helveticus]GFP03163.1 surface layer protein [Lactobacillus helveticus]
MSAGLTFSFSEIIAHQAQAATSEGTITMRFDGALVYDKNGKPLSSYPGAGTYLEKAHLEEDATVNYYEKPKYMNWYHRNTNKKAVFYNIGKGGYVLGYNVASLDDKGTLSVYRNSYVYDKNGKRLKKYQGSKSNTLIRKGTAANYVGKLNEMPNTDKNLPKFYYFNTGIQRTADKIIWPSYRTVKGKQYYNIGNGGYIKASNIKFINGKLLYASEATITMGKSLHKNGKYLVHNSEGKLTNKRISLKEGQKITVDRMLMNGRSCWRMKGTNDYLWGSEIKKFPLQSLRY